MKRSRTSVLFSFAVRPLARLVLAPLTALTLITGVLVIVIAAAAAAEPAAAGTRTRGAAVAGGCLVAPALLVAQRLTAAPGPEALRAAALASAR